MPAVDAPRVRRSFARLNKIHDLPNLLDIQRRSFEWLTDPENGGLRETSDDISPIAQAATPPLKAPIDLKPKTAIVKLTLPTGDLKGASVHVALSQLEITQLNNQTPLP